MRQRLDGWLKEWNLRQHYRADKKVGNELFNITLPFVHVRKEHGAPVQAIKTIRPRQVENDGRVRARRRLGPARPPT